MREEGVSRDYSQPRTCSGKKTIKSCKIQGNLDNVVLIDVDSDGLDNVIIIDVPESFQQKLRGSSVLREGQRFPCIISIDDDENDNVDHPEINEEGDVDLDSDGSSSKSSPASDYMQKSVDPDADDCQVIWEKGPAFILSNSKKTCPKKAPARNFYGLNSESESDSSETSTSDCEVMEGSFGELREQWEKASLKRKSNVRKCHSGLEDQEKFSWWWKPRSWENTDSHSKADRRGDTHVEDNSFFYDECQSVSGCGTSFQNEIKGARGHSSWSNEEGDDKQCHHTRTCSQDMEQNVVGEHSFPNSQARPNLHSDRGKASVQDEDASLCKGQHSRAAHNVNHRRLVSKDRDEEFSQPPSSCNETQYKSTGFEGKEKIVFGEKFVFNALSSDDAMVEDVVVPVENKARAVTEEFFVSKTPSLGTPEVNHEKADHQAAEKTDCGVKSFCRTQCHEILNMPGTPHLAERRQPFSDCSSNIQHYNERDPLSSPLGDVMPTVQRDIINEREKLKETDEYKQAAEEEWAARQRQLQIQAEEAQRLRKRRKAETLRLLDMERRQRQRVEEVRETQKKDEENLNIKERLRVEVRKELYKLEITCIDMASLLRGLGIHVEGGFHPLSHEVRAAYKQALLKFHPDRASRTNIRQQVEAEEKFKLISRMKDKLLSTSCH